AGPSDDSSPARSEFVAGPVEVRLGFRPPPFPRDDRRAGGPKREQGRDKQRSDDTNLNPEGDRKPGTIECHAIWSESAQWSRACDRELRAKVTPLQSSIAWMQVAAASCGRFDLVVSVGIPNSEVSRAKTAQRNGGFPPTFPIHPTKTSRKRMFFTSALRV